MRKTVVKFKALTLEVIPKNNLVNFYLSLSYSLTLMDNSRGKKIILERSECTISTIINDYQYYQLGQLGPI
jgi:hypothetical protein